MNAFWFNLNSTCQQLSQVEVEEVLKQEGYTWKSSQKGIFSIYQFKDQPSDYFFNRLGGTIWVAEEKRTTTSHDQILPLLKEIGHQEQEKHSFKRFAVWFYENSKYDQTTSQIFNQQLKSHFHLSYLNFRQPRLNAKQLQTDLVLIVVHFKKTFYLLKLRWYYPWEKFINRDKSKPFVQPTAGMLPHKISRVMVNLSLSASPRNIPTDHYLLDPFAGSGTILIEALDEGIPVVGIEKNTHAFQGLKENLAYFQSKASEKKPVYQLYQADATRVHLVVKEKIYSVATEPYLGPAFRVRTNRYHQQYLTTAHQPTKHLTQKDMEVIIDRLEKLYYLWLKHQKLLLKPGRKIVTIFPLLRFHDKFYRIKLFDNHQIEGYTLYQGPFTVKSQRDLIVRRQIVVLRRS